MIKYRNLLLLLGFVILTVVGCADCPEYALPECFEWQRTVTEEDSDGCGFSVCRPMPGCPDYEIPMCAEGVGLATETDANGCGMPVCASE